jgi:hypothetical protein
VWREADPWPPAAKLFVKPHELIYNKAVMPGPFTGHMGLSFAGLRSPARVFRTLRAALELQRKGELRILNGGYDEDVYTSELSRISTSRPAEPK